MAADISPAYRKRHTNRQHHAALTESVACNQPARRPARRHRSAVIAALVLLGAALAGILTYASLAVVNRHGRSGFSPSSAPQFPLPPAPSSVPLSAESESPSSSVWPAQGQAAFVESGQEHVQAGPNQHPAPIASVTKVMTAYILLRDHPLQAGDDGPVLTLTDADVADTARRRAQGQSVVSVAAGERLTERQALEALLLPSANNIAVVLARWDAGGVDQFVARMNAAAQSFGMSETRYTDPSGFEQTTVSTAADQVQIVERAMSLPVFAGIVAMPSATLPVAGTVASTDALLGHDGFVGVKTGSDNAAGGCFAFRAVRTIGGKQTTITGVVLGQPGANQIAAGLMAAKDMVDRIADR
jgi:D-alanyl-D-alanine carboxypeptidase (penicillin-binding protein 5/6)